MSDGVKYLPGTPEYEAYMAELLIELGKFRRREPPYDKDPEAKSPQEAAALRKFLGMDEDDAAAVVSHIEENS